MDLARIRKAIVAGIGGAVVTLVASVQAEAPTTSEGWVSLVAAAVAAGVVLGYSTYKVRNAGTVGGSDPRRQVRAGRPPL